MARYQHAAEDFNAFLMRHGYVNEWGWPAYAAFHRDLVSGMTDDFAPSYSEVRMCGNGQRKLPDHVREFMRERWGYVPRSWKVFLMVRDIKGRQVKDDSPCFPGFREFVENKKLRAPRKP